MTEETREAMVHVECVMCGRDDEEIRDGFCSLCSHLAGLQEVPTCH